MTSQALTEAEVDDLWGRGVIDWDKRQNAVRFVRGARDYAATISATRCAWALGRDAAIPTTQSAKP